MRPKTAPRLKSTSLPARTETKKIKAWPSPGEWARRRRILLTSTFCRLGIKPERVTDNGLWASQALDVLGPGSFAEFAAVRTPGRVLWCNFELARLLGFKVPRSNRLTSKFQEQLLAALSFRALTPAEDTGHLKTTVMYADRYGGDGLGPALGAGRAGFLPYGNLYVKGLGFTPLFRHNDPTDFVHSHGGVHLEDCMSEAIFGEVNENLFTRGSIRILAIIDQDKHVTDPTGQVRHFALAVRAGAQLRPGHLLGKAGRPSRPLLDKFVSIARATNQLVTRQDESSGAEIPDVASTMLRIIDDHALTGADGFRWRMIHGALSSSNMEMSGAMLDLPTQSAQPRTAPSWALDYANSIFGTEHMERAFQLFPVYRQLLRRTSPAMREHFNAKWINIPAEMEKAYRRRLQLKLLGAAGLKTALVRRIQFEHSGLACRFTDLVLKFSVLKNPGNVCLSKGEVKDVSVVDIFHLLGKFPAVYFSNPHADHSTAILRFLKPIHRGNRFHVAKRRAAVRLLAREFAGLYQELMNVCAQYAREYYGDLKSMYASIIARADFENRPLDALYCRQLYEELRQAIAAYKSTGNAEIIRRAIDRRISDSLRSVDGLLAQGTARRLSGGVELEMRAIDGVNYSVKAWNDERQTRRLHVSVPVRREDDGYSNAVPGLLKVSTRQIQSLRYRFSVDGWKTSGEVRGWLTDDGRDGLVIDFEDIHSFPLVGRLEGYFHFSDVETSRARTRKRMLRGYAFAIPDRQELISLVAGHSLRTA